MRTVESRVGRLENQIKAERGTGYILLDGGGHEVDAEVVRLPELGRDGEAVMPDGTKRRIVYEENWQRDNWATTTNTTRAILGDTLRIRIKRDDFHNTIFQVCDVDGNPIERLNFPLSKPMEAIKTRLDQMEW